MTDPILCGNGPVSGVEILSATGSSRHWSEQLHSTFTIAIVHLGERPTAAEWRTRGRSVTTAGGELMSINAGDAQATFRVHAPSAFDAVKFSPFWLEDAASDLPPSRRFQFRSPTCRNATVFQEVQRLVRGVSRGQDPFELESTCHEVARAVVIELAETLPRASEPSDLVRDPRLRRVRDYLLEQSSSRPTLQALENDTGLGNRSCVRSSRKASESRWDSFGPRAGSRRQKLSCSKASPQKAWRRTWDSPTRPIFPESSGDTTASRPAFG